MVVERAKESVATHRLGSGYVYRDDLEEIAKLLTEIGPVKIEIHEKNGQQWIAECPDDLSHPDIPKRLELIKMTARSSANSQAFEVELSRRNSKISITAPSPLTSGVYSAVMVVLRPRIGDYLVPHLLVWRLAWPSIIGSGMFWLTHAIWVQWFTSWFFVALSFIVRLLGVESWLGYKGNVTIRNEYRKSTFLARTRDDWVVGIVSMLIGLLLGYLLGRATGASHDPPIVSWTSW